ncbi:MAG: septal ring lytic transglycosylase RlpA family protein [Spirulinaceae cyanobacterium RM2_2_10]|nr:septal ring lytic transglycosylase RlpA family protein [Spirulinaceae cyanobacterium SM2_1_0]NJO19600.1 septal ring lytic transglycosylase RlpA family protein [Spirulinaceae cyanobacterium RM2_2_10]
MPFTHYHTCVALGFGAVSCWIAVAPSVEAGQPEKEVVQPLPAAIPARLRPEPSAELLPIAAPVPTLPPLTTSVTAPTPSLLPTFQGLASWYGPGFHGRRAASGEIFDQNAMTAAHRTLPFDTQVRVTNLENGRVTTVRITDRGPFVGDRVIDLSQAAARDLGMIEAGVVRVRAEVLTR